MKQEFPKISIVTPSFNQGKYLERTIISVLSQNYPNLEYIVIDGGSTDKSINIIKKYKSKLAHWVSETDHGQADAINKGFSRSSGEIMAWLNSDDILLPNSLFLIADIFNKFPKVEWLTGKSIIINEDDVIIKTGLTTGRIQQFIKWGLYHGKALGFIPQESTFWRRSLWKRAGSSVPSKHYCLDYELWKKFAQYSPLATIEAGIGAFRITPSQKTNEIEAYYREIHQVLTLLPNAIGFFGKVINLLIFRYFSPQIKFDRQNGKWISSSLY